MYLLAALICVVFVSTNVVLRAVDENSDLVKLRAL